MRRNAQTQNVAIRRKKAKTQRQTKEAATDRNLATMIARERSYASERTKRKLTQGIIVKARESTVYASPMLTDESAIRKPT